MGKYIDKSSLEIFKNFTEISFDDISLLKFEFQRFIEIEEAFKKAKDGSKTEDFHKRNLIECAEKISDIADSVFKSDRAKRNVPAKLRKKIEEVKNPSILERVTNEDIYAVATFVKRIFNLVTSAALLQGLLPEELGLKINKTSDEPLFFDKDENISIFFPKLFIINESFYNKKCDEFSSIKVNCLKHSKDYDSDSGWNADNLYFDALYAEGLLPLFELLSSNISYCVFVQNIKRISDYGFFIRKIDDETIRITINDYIRGTYVYDLIINPNTNEDLWCYLTNKIYCVKADDTFCSESNMANTNYKNRPVGCLGCIDPSKCECKKTEPLFMVLHCLIDYLGMKNSKIISVSDSNKKSVNSIPKYVPQNAIKVYDFYDNKELVKKYGNSLRFKGYEVCPHVRRSTYRYNPKTGLKDIYVRGSVVHKEKYEGFATADRIN